MTVCFMCEKKQATCTIKGNIPSCRECYQKAKEIGKHYDF